jgi:methyl-accepting chemotaxis protein
MNGAGKVSLTIKIMGAVFLPAALLFPVMLTLYIQGTGELTAERNKAMKIANTIAFDSAIASQRQHLEKMLTNVLMTDELLAFTLRPDDRAPRMVLEGQFLSLAKENITRFSLYNSDRKLIFQQFKDAPKRPDALPPSLHDTFSQAAKDAALHFYFRGTEASMPTSPAELCILSSIIDGNDAVVGYIELAIRSSLWINRIAELTGAKVLPYDPRHRSVPTAEHQQLGGLMLASLPEDLAAHSFWQTSADSLHFLANILPITGPDKSNVGFLLIVQDGSALVEAEKKRQHYGLGLSAVILICSQLLAYLMVSRGIVGPIDKIVAFASSLASGNVSTSLNMQASGEIQTMTTALNAMAAHIRTQAALAERIANGDLSMVVVPASEQDVLGHSLAAITENLGQMIEHISANAKRLLDESGHVAGFAEELGASSEVIESQTHKLTAAFEQISGNLEVVASSTEEMSASIQEISRASSESSETTKKAQQFSTDNAVIMRELNTVVNSISQANQAISDFADQTNLLALNATIEAARAGEAGRGFAVVASEVKDLAHKSMGTAKAVHADIENIERCTAQAVASTDTIAGMIARANDAAIGIAGAVEEQAAVANDISHNIAEAHSITSGFSRSIEELDQAASTTNDTIASLNASAEQLSRLAGTLKNSVDIFQLRGQG